MPKYENVVSLGHFCSPAIEFNSLNLRKASYPFDWIITNDFNCVLELIENNFKDFLNEELLFQSKEYPNHYKNIKYKLTFYHDFDELKSFNSQIDKVRQKYNRRIDRFYDTIKKPTLFLRYIVSKEEAAFINDNYEMIKNLLKSYMPDNDIIFVANKEDEYPYTSSDIKVWYVEKDKKDKVARRFIHKNEDLKAYILNNVPANDGKPHILHEKSRFERKLRKFCRRMNIYYHHKNTV